MRRHLIFGALILLVTVTVGKGSPQATFTIHPDELEGHEFVMRPTVEGRRKVYLPAPDVDFQPFVLHKGNRLFPLRASERVMVTKVKRKGDRMELSVRSSRLGKGQLSFYGLPRGNVTWDKWLDEIFELKTPESEFYHYVGNKHSRVLHLRGSNHLPELASREFFATSDEAMFKGYRCCGVCFLPSPNVSGYDTERVLAMMSLQQVRSTYPPLVDDSYQHRVTDLGTKVLDHWPVPLKGYRYRFRVLDSDDVNAFAVPTGYIFVTRGLIETLETEHELATVLAHEVTHVENRHTYRLWRNARRITAVVGILGALAGKKGETTGNFVAVMSSFVAKLFLSGFGRDREREADSFASLYLNAVGSSNEVLESVLKKLKYSNDTIDPFGRAARGPFATHPYIEERRSRAHQTLTRVFTADRIFQGLNQQGEMVATLTLLVQKLYGQELEVIATLSTTPELGKKDNVNTLTLHLGDRRLKLKERTAESVFPSDEVSALFGTTEASGFIEGMITGVSLKLRNVVRWVPEG